MSTNPTVVQIANLPLVGPTRLPIVHEERVGGQAPRIIINIQSHGEECPFVVKIRSSPLQGGPTPEIETASIYISRSSLNQSIMEVFSYK